MIRIIRVLSLERSVCSISRRAPEGVNDGVSFKLWMTKKKGGAIPCVSVVCVSVKDIYDFAPRKFFASLRPTEDTVATG
jgi:hypothetical protein